MSYGIGSLAVALGTRVVQQPASDAEATPTRHGDRPEVDARTCTDVVLIQRVIQ